MEDILLSIKKYVDSKEYFADARKWYMQKYIAPITQRSVVAVSSAICIIMVLALLLNTQILLPLSQQLKYAITVTNASAVPKGAKVVRADEIPSSPLLSIVRILITDYVKSYEQYNYNNMTHQHEYIKNASTRIVLKSFEDYMSQSNINSPLLRYQQDGRRYVTITNIEFTDTGHANIYFTSIGKDATNRKFEDINWLASMSFETDQIKLDLPSHSPFNFIVTNYAVRFIKNNLPTE